MQALTCSEKKHPQRGVLERPVGRFYAPAAPAQLGQSPDFLRIDLLVCFQAFYPNKKGLAGPQNPLDWPPKGATPSAFCFS